MRGAWISSKDWRHRRWRRAGYIFHSISRSQLNCRTNRLCGSRRIRATRRPVAFTIPLRMAVLNRLQKCQRRGWWLLGCQIGRLGIRSSIRTKLWRCRTRRPRKLQVSLSRILWAVPWAVSRISCIKIRCRRTWAPTRAPPSRSQTTTSSRNLFLYSTTKSP